MTTYMLAELLDKRNELAGKIVQTENLVRELRADLAHVEAAIRILRPGTELPRIVRKRLMNRPHYFRRGELTRLLLHWLGERGADPFTVDDVMPLVVGKRQLSLAERTAVRTTIHTAFNKMERRGAAARVASTGRIVRWRATAA
jgi:hypothetical protein